MTNTDVQLLVAQARSEADNPALKVSNYGLEGGNRQVWKTKCDRIVVVAHRRDHSSTNFLSSQLCRPLSGDR